MEQGSLARAQEEPVPESYLSSTALADDSMRRARRNNVREAVRATVESWTTITRQGQASAIAELNESQKILSEQLSALLTQMEGISSAVEGLTLDPATSLHMEAARESLRRSRTKLVTIRGRLGRLRGFEENDRLFRVQRQVSELRVIGSECLRTPPSESQKQSSSSHRSSPDVSSDNMHSSSCELPSYQSSETQL